MLRIRSSMKPIQIDKSVRFLICFAKKFENILEKSEFDDIFELNIPIPDRNGLWAFMVLILR